VVKAHVALVVILAACQAQPLTQTHAVLDATPLALDFGARVLGSTSALSLVLTNRGDRKITLSDPTLEGATRPVFTVSATPGELGAAATVTIQVTYQPVLEGADGVTIHFATSADNADVFVSVAARGVAAEPVDAGSTDAGIPDAGQADAGIPDAGPTDAGPVDAGVTDAGLPDSGAPDSGAFTWDSGLSLCPGATDVRDVVWFADSGVEVGLWPTAAWTGSQLAVAWTFTKWTGATAHREIELSFLDFDGTPSGPSMPISPVDAFDSKWAAVAWTGSGFGLGYLDDRSGVGGMYFTHTSAQGAPVGVDHAVPLALRPDRQYLSLVWNPARAEYALMWSESSTAPSGYSVGFARLDSTGAPIGASMRLDTNDAGSSALFSSNALAWVGDGYVTAFSESSTLVALKLDPTGQRVKRTAITQSLESAVAWSGSEVGLATIEGSQNVRFHRLDAMGSPVDAGSVSLGTAGSGEWPVIAWTGTDWLVAWASSSRTISVARVDAAGTVLWSRDVVCAAAVVAKPFLVVEGRFAAVVYVGSNAGVFEGHLAVFPL
jgi:hypothetical protein